MRKLVVLAALLALVVVGCGETVIDSAKTEDAIESNLRKSSGIPVTSVDCPSDVEVEPKATFDCTIQVEGGEEQIATLVIRNDDADVSLVNLVPANPDAAAEGQGGGSGDGEGASDGGEDTASGDE